MCILWIIIYVTLLCCESYYLSWHCLAIYLLLIIAHVYRKNRSFPSIALILSHTHTKLKAQCGFQRDQKTKTKGAHSRINGKHITAAHF